jgi:adenosylcobinamide-phosphate synthase
MGQVGGRFVMILALGMILDAYLGEPKWLWSRIPHPAILMGRAIGYLDARYNTSSDKSGPQKRRDGALAIAGLVLAMILLGLILSPLPAVLHIIIIAIIIAHRSLVDHVANVAEALGRSTGDGRKSVAKIVGRDTSQMTPPEIARAALESGAENLSDGVIAPIFWYVLLGLPGLLAYKMINTADSMIGYKSETYKDFGWASAKLDDLVNWAPARLTAILMVLCSLEPDNWEVVRRDANKHRSPNAGWPEAAMAAGIDVALSGPRSYDGELRDFPYVYEEGRHDISPGDIMRGVDLLWKTWWGALIAFGLLSLII